MNMIQKADYIACYAHGSINQKRKYTLEDYISHPRMVANIIKTIEHDENMICAALLHDVIEDTFITYHTLLNEFNQDVASMVMLLTNSFTTGTRRYRKQQYAYQLGNASSRVQTIKLADCIHNCSDIFKHDPVFAQKYFEEKKQLLPFLKNGNILLYNQLMLLLSTNGCKQHV